jgi:hypothetical protein
MIDCLVRVEWMPEKMKRLPKGRRYITVAEFQGKKDSQNSAWSIVISFNEIPSIGSNTIIARAKFLMSEGPHEWLSPGVVFSLLEGDKKTATITVLSD